jgi:hypothetical protein
VLRHREKSTIDEELKILDRLCHRRDEILDDTMQDMGGSVLTGNSVQRLGSVDQMGRKDHYVREHNKLNPPMLPHAPLSKSDTKKRLAFH